MALPQVSWVRTLFQERIEDESRSCAVKTGAPLRSFSRFLSSHLESIPARGTDAEGKAKLEVRRISAIF